MPSGASRRVAVMLFALVLATLGCPSCDDEPPARSPTGAGLGTDLPWPLPLPSTSMEIAAELRSPASAGSHLTVAADRLAKALHSAGYADLRFYDIPDGFALATPLELIDDQGLAMAHPDPKQRFSAIYPPEGFFTMRFWSDLLRAKTGRFRLFVFVVIEHPFGYSKDVTDSQVLWKHPSAELPLDRADLAYTDRDHWYALVYEVAHPAGTDRVTMVEHPADPALHLAKSGILASLQRLAGGEIAPIGSTALRDPVFADRTKKSAYDRGRARLDKIRSVLLATSLTEAQASTLGFECASLRTDQKAVAGETDPVAGRFLADVDKTCGLDVPLSTSYAELRAIDAKRGSGSSLKSECLGLKLALGDFMPQYLSNPQVTVVGGKYATLCPSE